MSVYLRAFLLFFGAPMLLGGVLFFCMSQMFKPKVKYWQMGVMLLVLSACNIPKLIWGGTALVSRMTQLVYYPIALLLYPLMAFQGSVWKRLVLNLMLTGGQVLAEGVAYFALIAPQQLAEPTVYDFAQIWSPYLALGLTVDIMFSWGVLFFGRMMTAHHFSPTLLSAFLLPASMVGMAYACVYFPLFSQMWIVSIFIGCAGLVVLMRALVSLEEKERLERELGESRHAMELEQAHYRGVEQRREELSRIRHDFKNQLAAISALLQSGDEPDARRMLHTLARDIEETREDIYCAIPVVNAVLSEKARECRERQIALEVDLSIPASLSADPLHLCSIFSNLLDNAIRGAASSGEKEPAIVLRSRSEGDYLFLKVTNPAPPPKPPQPGRGLGQRILTDLAQRYGGDYHADYDGGTYTAVVSLLR